MDKTTLSTLLTGFLCGAMGVMVAMRIAANIRKFSKLTDPIPKLEKLSALLEKGHLTKEEFEAQKKKLLS